MALANIFLPWGDDTKSDRIIGGEEVSFFLIVPFIIIVSTHDMFLVII